jgi:hypothetical protein
MSTNKIDLEALGRDLQKLDKPQRGWFGRNWKWFVPLLLLLIVVVVGAGYGCWFYQRILGNEAYQKAMVKIAADKDIVTALGESIKLRYFSPTPSFRRDAGETDILWTVVGSAEKQAKVHVFQRLMSGKWETIISEIVLPNNKKISLIDEDEGNAPPPFVPQTTPAADSNSTEKPSEENMPDDLSPNIPSPEGVK